MDLDAVIFVSCMAIMVGGLGLFANACISGSAVFIVPQFHDTILVAGFVYGMFCGFIGR